MPPTLHIDLPRGLDTLLHTTVFLTGEVWQCHTRRGAGRCSCGTFRLCDPSRHRCGEDCPCRCHGRSDALVQGGLDA